MYTGNGIDTLHFPFSDRPSKQKPPVTMTAKSSYKRTTDSKKQRLRNNYTTTPIEVVKPATGVASSRPPPPRPPAPSNPPPRHIPVVTRPHPIAPAPTAPNGTSVPPNQQHRRPAPKPPTQHAPPTQRAPPTQHAQHTQHIPPTQRPPPTQPTSPPPSHPPPRRPGTVPEPHFDLQKNPVYGLNIGIPTSSPSRVTPAPAPLNNPEPASEPPKPGPPSPSKPALQPKPPPMAPKPRSLPHNSQTPTTCEFLFLSCAFLYCILLWTYTV